MIETDPGQVMTIEQYQIAKARKPAAEAIKARFDLNQAINIMVGAPTERIKAQQEQK